MSLIGDELAESSDPNKLAADMREPCPQCAILLSRVTAYDSLLALVRAECKTKTELDYQNGVTVYFNRELWLRERAIAERKYKSAYAALHQWLDAHADGAARSRAVNGG